MDFIFIKQYLCLFQKNGQTAVIYIVLCSNFFGNRPYVVISTYHLYLLADVQLRGTNDGLTNPDKKRSISTTTPRHLTFLQQLQYKLGCTSFSTPKKLKITLFAKYSSLPITHISQQLHIKKNQIYFNNRKKLEIGALTNIVLQHRWQSLAPEQHRGNATEEPQYATVAVACPLRLGGIKAAVAGSAPAAAAAAGSMQPPQTSGRGLLDVGQPKLALSTYPMQYYIQVLSCKERTKANKCSAFQLPSKGCHHDFF